MSNKWLTTIIRYKRFIKRFKRRKNNTKTIGKINIIRIVITTKIIMERIRTNMVNMIIGCRNPNHHPINIRAKSHSMRRTENKTSRIKL